VTAWVGDWLRAFGLTLAVEAIVAGPMLRRGDASPGRCVAAVFFANLTTHPLVWFLVPGIAVSYAARLGISEAGAVALEAGVYLLIWPGLGSRRALLVSLLANGASLAVGLVLRAAHLLP
jgi:hypothetical protein